MIYLKSMFFGRQVALDGNRALVSDVGDAESPEDMIGTGIVFELQSDESWLQTNEFSGTGNLFGSSIALSKDLACIGAPGDGCCGAVYVYELESSTSTVDLADISGIVLDVPYPNPVQTQATIEYSIHSRGLVKLALYSESGLEVAVLHEGVQGQGRYQMQFDASQYAAGAYFVSLQFESKTVVQPIVLLE